MKFTRNAIIAAKTMPKGVWIAAVIVPGGLTVVGMWLIAKGAYYSVRGKNAKC